MSRRTVPCAECGRRTESVTGLCRDHRERSGAKLPSGPCVKCHRRTRSQIGICSRCQRAKKGDVIPVQPACSGCAKPIGRRSTTGMCLPCWNAHRYGTPIEAPSQEDRESPNVLDPAGWVKDRRGIYHHVGVAP